MPELNESSSNGASPFAALIAEASDPSGAVIRDEAPRAEIRTETDTRIDPEGHGPPRFERVSVRRPATPAPKARATSSAEMSVPSAVTPSVVAKPQTPVPSYVPHHVEPTTIGVSADSRYVFGAAIAVGAFALAVVALFLRAAPADHNQELSMLSATGDRAKVVSYFIENIDQFSDRQAAFELASDAKARL